jgi:two-component system LytT family sensor kinase
MEEKLIQEWMVELSQNGNLQQDTDGILRQLSLDWLAQLQQTFMTATGMNGNIVDLEGVPVTRIIDTQSPKFCRMIHSVPDGLQRCMNSDQRTLRRSILAGSVEVCKCHAGLYDSAVPIQFKEHELGAFITGQVLLSPPTDAYTDEILERVSDLGLDRDQLKETILEIPVITVDKLKAATELMKLLVDYIVKTIGEAESSRREAEMRSLYLETEMKVIQSTLHPHFLFNILNLVSGQALLEGAQDTYKTVNHLSKMLRHIVKSFRPLIPLKEEMENLQSYMELQRLRFQDRLRFDIQFDREYTGDALIPSLTLQILIENAIKHGIEPKEGECFVIINIKKVDRRVHIQISDNGVGIPAEQIKMLMQEDGPERISGIVMIYKRLRYYFQGDYDFQFSPREGGGTDIFLSIPETTV